MVYHKPYLLLFTLVISFMAGCDIKKNTTAPDAVFTTIYNDNDINASYYPLGVVQQLNGQLIVISGIANDTSKYAWTGISVIAADPEGRFLWGNNTTSGNVNPVPEVIYNHGETYFICMNEVTLATQLMKVDAATKNISLTKTYNEIIYPLYTYQTSDGGLLIISYDRMSRSTLVTKTDGSFNEIWQKNYNVMEDAEAKVIAHLSKLGQQFPFFAGEIMTGNTASHYFVNSFFNYSFSMLIVSAANGNQTGVVNGYRYDGAISAALHLSEDTFSVARYTFGDNYVLPKTEINADEVATTNDLAGTKFSELNYDAKVLLREKGEANQKRIIFITSTKVGQLAMYQFSHQSGKLLKSNYYGHSNPVEIAAAINTSDGGMLLLCRMIVAGRYPRVAIYKVSAGEFN